MIKSLPRLVTFDGEARSGKGTIVQAAKDYLRDERGHKVMLIDAGQVFRVLVVAAERSGVDIDDADSIDRYLSNPVEADAAARLVKAVYHMTKDERDTLLYTPAVSANSAKIGARPLSQKLKDNLLRKWLRDARDEGFDTVLLDGRALEEVGAGLEREGLCRYVVGLFFVCDPVVGARRELGYATIPYEKLQSGQKSEVDGLVAQIVERNKKDRQRAVQPNTPPANALAWRLPDPAPAVSPDMPRPMLRIDTSADLDKPSMTGPVSELVARYLA